MKRRARSTDIFSLSFLDIVSCSFGAVVLLLIISKPSETDGQGSRQTMNLLDRIYQAEAEKSDIDTLREQEALNLEGTLKRNEGLSQQLAAIQTATRDEVSNSEALARARAVIERAKDALENLAQTRDTSPDPVVSDSVAGIPVDSDYVIFVIDTSGSMRQKWTRVKATIDSVLTMHPQVKGFQIMNDEGTHLKNAGQWIPDTPMTRRDVLAQTNSWSPASNSNPFSGISRALQYARPGRKVAIYVFGDDFSGGEFDTLFYQLNDENRSSLNGDRLARIHGIAFSDRLSNFDRTQGSERAFALFMAAITRANDGAFISVHP